MRSLAALLAVLALLLANGSRGAAAVHAEPVDCQYAGIHFQGSVPGSATVCFTLTPNGKVLREFAVTFPERTAGKNCPGDTRRLRVSAGEEALDLVTDGSIDVRHSEPGVGNTRAELVIHGSMRGSSASGTLSYSRGACGPGLFAWKAQRSGAPPPAAPAA